ncbi:F0F1 ATP synthase subunit delta [soil metagenome]
MGSSTREALVEARSALAALTTVDLATGEQLLAAGRVIGESSPLLAALVDATAEQADKVSIVDAIFANYTAAAKTLLGAVASARWSNGTDLLAGIEEIGFRTLARSAAASVSIEDELFTFGEAVASNSELELAVSSKLGSAESKASLVRALVDGKASKQTAAILEHLVQQPRERRIGTLLTDAATAVADERGFSVAIVTTAAALSAAQVSRLTTALGTSYGREIHVNHVIDPTIVGGLRVQVGDDVIDGTISRRLTELRLQLAS